MAPASTRRTLGRYEPVAAMATGHFGPLWLVRAQSPGHGEPHALARRVQPGVPEGPVVDLIAEAAWTAMEVSHPLLPAVLEVIVQGSEVAVVQSYVEGVSLRALQRSANALHRPISPEVGLRFARDVAEALSSLHAQAGGLDEPGAAAFGGFTPDSLLVGTDGRVHLFDALVSGAAGHSNPVREHADRVAYTAPERLDDPGAATNDPRADVFSLGVFLWEILTDRRLFIGSGPSLKQKVGTLRIPRLDALDLKERSPVASSLSDCVARAIERDPSLRQQDMAELLSAIVASGVACATEDQVRSYLEEVGAQELDRLRQVISGPLPQGVPPDEPPRLKPARQEPQRPKPRPPRQDPPRLDPPRLDPPRLDPPRQDPPRQDPPRQDPPRQDPPRQDPPRQDPPRQDPPRLDPPRQDPPRLEQHHQPPAARRGVVLPSLRSEATSEPESAASASKQRPHRLTLLGVAPPRMEVPTPTQSAPTVDASPTRDARAEVGESPARVPPRRGPLRARPLAGTPPPPALPGPGAKPARPAPVTPEPSPPAGSLSATEASPPPPAASLVTPTSSAGSAPVDRVAEILESLPPDRMALTPSAPLDGRTPADDGAPLVFDAVLEAVYDESTGPPALSRPAGFASLPSRTAVEEGSTAPPIPRPGPTLPHELSGAPQVTRTATNGTPHLEASTPPPRPAETPRIPPASLPPVMAVPLVHDQRFALGPAREEARRGQFLVGLLIGAAGAILVGALLLALFVLASRGARRESVPPGPTTAEQRASGVAPPAPLEEARPK
ncbi:MAG: protein kinase [Polyangiaceae bacterium]|nr:protein kinase [Polyangiaceae bacterium]